MAELSRDEESWTPDRYRHLRGAWGTGTGSGDLVPEPPRRAGAAGPVLPRRTVQTGEPFALRRTNRHGVARLGAPPPYVQVRLLEYLDRYTKESTRNSIAETFLTLARWRGDPDPLTLSTAEIGRWIATAKANNTARRRLSTLRMFFRWAVRQGLVQENPIDELEHLAKTYPVTYGKVQSKNPARFLTHQEAYGQLVGACQDGTHKGLRDEIAIRLGLAGIRASEVTSLTVREVDLRRPWISYVGKDNVPGR